MFNYKAIKGIIEKSNLYLNSRQTDDFEHLEERVGTSEYSELSPYDFYFTHHQGNGNLTTFIDLTINFDETKMESYFGLKIAHYSYSFRNFSEYLECSDYIKNIENIVKEINTEINKIPVWVSEEE